MTKEDVFAITPFFTVLVYVDYEFFPYRENADLTATWKRKEYTRFYSTLGRADRAPDSGDYLDEAYKLEYLKDLLIDAEISRPEHVNYYMDYHNIINLMI